MSSLLICMLASNSVLAVSVRSSPTVQVTGQGALPVDDASSDRHLRQVSVPISQLQEHETTIDLKTNNISAQVACIKCHVLRNDTRYYAHRNSSSLSRRKNVEERTSVFPVSGQNHKNVICCEETVMVMSSRHRENTLGDHWTERPTTVSEDQLKVIMSSEKQGQQ